MTFNTSASGCGWRAMLGRAFSLFALIALVAMPAALRAQTAGEGSITGTVTDATGAAIPNATVTATNKATNISTTRTSSGTGDYAISPILPGTYTVKVTAQGFKTLVQDNIVVDAMAVKGFNAVMAIGTADTTVTVTEAPPSLNTTNATIGLTMENSSYSELPLVLSAGGQTQRDPTQFGNLAPGVSSGARLPIVGGAGNYLGQLYLDGLPAETVNQQGDNRVVSLTMNADAVDQFQIVTSTPPAEYSGAGSENFTMKSGGLKYHGSVADFVRNTAFDAWCFTCKWVQVTNASGVKSYQSKPGDHQNELSVNVGGKAPFTGNKLFFFFSYDRFRSRVPGSPTLLTIPTALMRTGDFTELRAGIAGAGLTGVAGDPSAGGTNAPFLYDPLSTVCTATACTRTPFQGLKNGIPTYNVIPSADLSNITTAMQKYLPAPTNNTLTNNYLGYVPKGWDNYVYDARIDYDLSSRNRISGLIAKGKQQYLNNFSAPLLPVPYTGGTYAVITPQVYDVEDAFVISNNMTNQLKYGFARFSQPQVNASYGITQYLPAAFGITNLPDGDASLQFPGVSFAGAGAFGNTVTEQTWTANSTASSIQKVIPNNYALVDNLLWTKGRHALTFGISIQWQQGTLAAPVGYSGIYSIATTQYATANYSASSLALNSGSGFSYASFLLGAVGGSPTIQLQPVSETSGRYRPIAPYVEDRFKVNSKLTLDMGLRWDYLPSFHEVKDRWTFLNPNLTNPLTGTPGLLQFAGNYGGQGVSCGCRTPVHTYWKNWGPRIGAIFSPDEKTVFRAGIGIVFTQGGGTGGRGGYATGSGQTGFNMTAIGNAETTSTSTGGVQASPSYWLGTQSYLSGKANTAVFGPGFTYPSAPVPGIAAQELNTGFYVDSSNVFHTAAGVGYADPYFSDRAPEMVVYNFGLERSLTKDLTIALNYVGNESHFILNSTSSGTGTARGYWSNQLNPIYLAGLGAVSDTTGKIPILNAPATAVNVAKAQAAMPGINIPAFFQAAAAKSSTATIAQGLVAFPQYSSVSDTYGAYTGNFNYNSFQLMLQQRVSHGLTFNLNYTYSKNVGDDGPFRTGFAVPAAAISGGGHAWSQDRMDRSFSTINQPETINAFGVYQLPFGNGGSLLRRELLGGWKLSGIYTYRSGTPILVTWGGACTTGTGSAATYPGQGQCMPDLSGTVTNARINGSYGTGPNGTTACNIGVAPIGGTCKQIQYIDVNAFKTPTNVSTVTAAQYLIGNAPRTRALNLNGPGTQNIDAAVKRSFPLFRETSFTFEADCANVWNKVTFNSPSGGWAPGSATFGGIGGASSNPRAWQFAGRFSF